MARVPNYEIQKRWAKSLDVKVEKQSAQGQEGKRWLFFRKYLYKHCRPTTTHIPQCQLSSWSCSARLILMAGKGIQEALRNHTEEPAAALRGFFVSLLPPSHQCWGCP